MAQFLPGINAMQTGLAQNLGQLELGAMQRGNAIKLQLAQAFLQRIMEEMQQKKAEQRQQTRQRQQQATSAGALLAAALTGGTSLAATGIPAGLQGAALASNISNFQSGQGGINDFLGPPLRR